MPRTATFSTAASVAWSTGELFDGYVLLGIALPTASSVAYPSVALDASQIKIELPLWIKVPIKDGTVDTATKVFWTADMEPPNCRYVAYWYDINDQRIYPAVGDSPELFTITASPHTLTVPTLTSPSVGTAPTPG